MAQNYAEAFAPMALEAFAAESVTNVFQAKYDWTDVKTVKVFTNATITPSAYTPSAGYGSPTLVGNTVDTLTVAADYGFPALIDKLAMESTEGTMRAAEWLGTQTRQQIVPMVDAYVFDALYDACPTGQISTSAAITSANAYTTFLAGQTMLSESYVPKPGRVAFVTPTYLEKLKVDSNFTKASDIAQSEIVFNGMVGRIDGVPVIEVPDSILNATDHHMDFIIVHTDAVALPFKLVDTQIYESVPGYSGSEIDARYVWDCFLLDALNDGIYIHKHAG